MKTLLAFLFFIPLALAQQTKPDVWIDPATKSMWTIADNGSGLSWSQAKRYCQESSVGGFKDWTLPSIDQLQALFGGPEDAGGHHSKGPLKLTGWEWSATPGSQDGEGWTLDFGDGARASVAAGDSGLNRALCVRNSARLGRSRAAARRICLNWSLPTPLVETATATSLNVWPYRFHFRALDSVHFPDEKATNVVRGAFGTLFRRLACLPECEAVQSCGVADSCPYARIFEPKQQFSSTGEGPSGLADWPRPFVFRALHLNGRTIPPAQDFHFDLILFEPPERALPYFVLTFRELVRTGLGPGRGRASLRQVEDLAAGSVLYEEQQFTEVASPQPLRFDFAAAIAPPRLSRVVVQFLTPTEIKAEGGLVVERPEFAALFARLRDRLSNLRACYQGGALTINFRELGEAAKRVRLLKSDLRSVAAVRQSSRTGQRHSIGGFVGTVEYEGELAIFLPYLQAGRWTGVGRHTVWGKGEMRSALTLT